jgi:hypothetical protein
LTRQFARRTIDFGSEGVPEIEPMCRFMLDQAMNLKERCMLLSVFLKVHLKNMPADAPLHLCHRGSRVA